MPFNNCRLWLDDGSTVMQRQALLGRYKAPRGDDMNVPHKCS